jgi:hypothetical protein
MITSNAIPYAMKRLQTLYCFNRLNLVLMPIATKVRPNSSTLNGSVPLLTMMGTTAFVAFVYGIRLSSIDSACR